MTANPLELIIDNFAGGGGASLGLERALGRVDIAINHDPQALAMHIVNHPQTRHLVQNINAVDPVEVCQGRPVGLAWFSPDCTHHSKAAGRRPRQKRIRDLAWVVIHWAQRVRPRIICLENVEEFREWGPLTADGQPCPDRKGETFQQWLGEFQKAGYKVEHRELRACDYGAPTIRKRLFLIARCDGLPIVWPEPTHGPGRLPYRTAAECIEWDRPCPSIFGRKRGLAPATMRRIARGLKRYVLDAVHPFIVPVTHRGDDRTYPLDEPMRTITCAPRGEQALISPYTVGLGGRAGQSRPRSADEPMATTTSKADTALVVPFLTKFNQNSIGQELTDPMDTVMAGAPRFGLIAPHLVVNTSGHPGGPADDPLHTVTTGGHHAVSAPYFVPHHGEREGQAPRCMSPEAPLATATPQNNPALVAAWMVQHNLGATGHPMTDPVSTVLSTGSQQQLATSHLAVLRNNMDGKPLDEPLQTILTNNHFMEIRAFLQAYYGTEQDARLDAPLPTITTKDRFGLVVTWMLIDIGMRMLSPRELFRAQGFPDSYILDPVYEGKPLTKTAQVRCCGNSVCPPLAEAIARANYVADLPLPSSLWAMKRRRAKVAVGQGALL